MSENLILILLIIFLFIVFAATFLSLQNTKKTIPAKYKQAYKSYSNKDFDSALINGFIALEIILKNKYKKNVSAYDLINNISDKNLKSKLHQFRMDRNLLIHENRSVSEKIVAKHLNTLKEIAKNFGYDV